MDPRGLGHSQFYDTNSNSLNCLTLSDGPFRRKNAPLVLHIFDYIFSETLVVRFSGSSADMVLLCRVGNEKGVVVDLVCFITGRSGFGPVMF